MEAPSSMARSSHIDGRVSIVPSLPQEKPQYGFEEYKDADDVINKAGEGTHLSLIPTGWHGQCLTPLTPCGWPISGRPNGTVWLPNRCQRMRSHSNSQEGSLRARYVCWAINAA